ncbi:hypothetical protein QFC21_002848 [Naganishia friedmannii]|uniref:Uncharacterized protein n=1 Tax=Naganishia friedmannii TaxID=89922 RepID=A0ACC2VTD5_9TREE|nr:hypothetical protein QFC21_002848 [Naganishia friedmannii]
MPGPHAETSACGADCVAVVHQHGESKGSKFDLSLPLTGTISTYIACPPGETPDSMKQKKAKKVIVWAADVFGPHFLNNQLLVDWHAANGYLVLSPDFFHGEELDTFRSKPDFSLQEWIPQWKKTVKDEQGNDIDRTSLLLKEWIKEVKKMYGDSQTKYAIIGKCLLSSVTMKSKEADLSSPHIQDSASARLMSWSTVLATKSLLSYDLGAIVHPAHLDDDAAFDKLKKPLYASLAEQDRHFGPERRNTLMASLTRLSTPEAPDGMSGEVAGTSGYDYMVQVFSGVMHGFGTRGDMSIERNRWAKETSAKACRDWFDRFLV